MGEGESWGEVSSLHPGGLLSTVHRAQSFRIILLCSAVQISHDAVWFVTIGIPSFQQPWWNVKGRQVITQLFKNNLSNILKRYV